MLSIEGSLGKNSVVRYIVPLSFVGCLDETSRSLRASKIEGAPLQNERLIKIRYYGTFSKLRVCTLTSIDE